MSEYATFVKVGTMVALLQMIERDVVFRDLSLENPIRAIREVSHDVTCRRKIKLANGRELSALDIQWEYLDRAMRFARSPGFPPEVQGAIDRWEHLLTGLEKDPMTLDREVDWVIKHRLLERYSDRRGIPMSDPRMSMMDLSYHDVDRKRGLYYLLESKGLVDRVVTDEKVALAVRQPPQTTRATAPWCLHQGGKGTKAGLHRGLGAPQAERPGTTHRDVQGPVQGTRRAGREADRESLILRLEDSRS